MTASGLKGEILHELEIRDVSSKGLMERCHIQGHVQAYKACSRYPALSWVG